MAEILLTATNYLEHNVAAVSGSNPGCDLMYAAGCTTGQTFARGSLVYLTADGEFTAGGGDHTMPIWVNAAYNDFDVAHMSGGFRQKGPGGFVGTGGYELFTTEYDTTQTYAPNDLLKASATAGKVTLAGTYNSDVCVVGCVSRGVVADKVSTGTSTGTNVLYFWPLFIPKMSTAG